MLETFWYVYSPKHEKPKHKHETEELAEKEAIRLAGIYKGDKFYVLQVKSVSFSPMPEIITEKAKEIPF